MSSLTYLQLYFDKAIRAGSTVVVHKENNDNTFVLNCKKLREIGAAVAGALKSNLKVKMQETELLTYIHNEGVDIHSQNLLEFTFQP